jgi:glycosyltransferase involved in cell wall biosynthesis
MVRGGLVVKAVVLAVPGDLATPTGGYAYDRRIIAELPALGWQVEVCNLGDGFPRPTAQTRATACARLAAILRGRAIVIDGLAFGVLPEAAEMLRASHPLVALVHHPLALESGLSAGESAALHASERAALDGACRVITTSAATARVLAADYGVAPDRLSVVEPGTDRAVVQRRPRDGTVALLAVGAVVERKGYDVLVAALANLKDLHWRLVIVGDCGRSPETSARLASGIARLDLAGRISLCGAVTSEQLTQLYASADLFVLASRFEGYGMAYAEAIAHGLPVVGTTGGAIPQTVPPSAGILVPPGDIEALAQVLRELIGNDVRRRALAMGARAEAVALPSWADSGARFARVLESLS